MKKNVIAIILLLILSIIGFYKIDLIKAFSNSLGTITQAANSYTIDSASEYGMAIKLYSNSPALCTQYLKETPAGTGVECTLNDDWTSKTRAGVAAIIDSAKTSISSSTMTPEYFAAELAINEFLYEKNGNNTTNHITGAMNLSSTYKNLYDNYLSLAKNTYDNYSDPSVTLSSNILYFTKQDDYYISNSITITSTDTVNITTNKGTIVRNGNNFQIKIFKSDLTFGSKTSIMVSVTATKDISVARNYTCGSYQSLTPVFTETDPKRASASATGSLNLTKLIIKKINDDKEYVSGSVIKIENEDKTYTESFTTDGKAITIEGLELGKYTITEVSSSNKYVLNSTPQTITFSDTELSKTVEIVNKLTKVEISKIGIVDGKLLKGAKLQIENIDGDVLYSWESSDKVYVVEGLETGKYYLVETSAPLGYELNKERVEFIVDGKKEIVKVEMKNALKVDVPNTLSSRSALLLTIAMFDIALGIGILTYVKKNKFEQ